MSENPLQSQLITSKLIASLAARTTLETPGVLRLEPTVKGFLARLGPAALQRLSNSAGQNGTYRDDGVRVTINDNVAVVHLDIATDIAYTALNVAETVQQRVRGNIGHTGLTVGKVDISILAIEPPPPAKIS
ncbi:Asp23/Gls24 family envelope stress response protein [Paeniglutamicibacter antarcticus]|uniref:Asp23/Gls24 family envelope stress response protein n=1 Tax=Arthrobacter terrae TaxID=2935737 RepID=A0A931GB77_9MICC|nr:Asp23/Gls24 family envelope stress response protein [Arthrobacter terrae]MBG0740457.1 Asp23/Gls24 family envelope stress response protein [Arthrobacter terrae]